jgi:DNA polymerase
MRPATIDFETRSACDLKKCGSWKYSLHPTTQVLCLAFRLPHWKSGRTALWHPAFPHLGIAEADCPELPELFRWILDGHLIEAHNAWFERGMWVNVMQAQYGWPAVPAASWRCSAAKAAAHALPRALDQANKAIGLSARKDPEGVKKMKESAIKRMFKPRKPRKRERELWAETGRPAEQMPLLWWESVESLAGLWAYCRQDVLAEEALSIEVPDLPDSEVAMYLLDQQINETGVRLDRRAIGAALALIAEETVRLNAEIAELTGGVVTQVTQRQRLIGWLAEQGLTLDNTQKQTIEEMLDPENEEEDLPPWVCKTGQLTGPARRALEILRELGKSSTAKYEKMRDWICPDGRMHGSLLYHGASTGRWSGAGVQPHNFPKGTIKDWNMEDAWLYLTESTREQIQQYWGSVMAPLSQALRGVIVPSPGKQLYVADYAAIEARVLLWLAEDEEALEVFRQGGDMYCVMASDIYGHPVTKKEHPDERQLGKVAILGLGYQMGAGKFVATAATYGITIDEDFATDVVDTYRTKFYLVKQMWWDQEEAAIKATQRPGTIVTCGRIQWQKRRAFLYAKLPSGRELAYPFPQVRLARTPWGTNKSQLSFMGVNPYNHQWERLHTYGGMIVENLVQAISRDIMAHAMQVLAAGDIYQPILTVHDELVAEAHPVLGSVQNFVTAVSGLPDWGAGIPIEAEGWTGVRYRK